MKGFITKTAAGLCLCATLTALAGCIPCLRQIYDPCWPERYNFAARDSIRGIAFAQTEKGHILDQTIWNWQFETDPKTGLPTDRLNGAGIEQLKYISRRLPIPDCHLFVQHAQDLPYVAEMGPERVVELRNELNSRRIQAIQRFMATQPSTGHVNYEVAIHDFAPPGLPSSVITGTLIAPLPIQGALYPKLENNFQGVLPGGGGITTGGASGASAGGR